MSKKSRHSSPEASGATTVGMQLPRDERVLFKDYFIDRTFVRDNWERRDVSLIRGQIRTALQAMRINRAKLIKDHAWTW